MQGNYIPDFSKHIISEMNTVNHNFVKYDIFHTPDEAIMFIMVKVHLKVEIFLFYRASEDFVLLINDIISFEQCSEVKYAKIHWLLINDILLVFVFTANVCLAT